MREYKFRGLNYQVEWVYGNFIHSKRFNGCSNEFRIHDPYTGMESDVIPESVGMFTGLQDRNGIDIYEGDIMFNSNKTLITLKEDLRLYLVKWQNGEYDEENKWLNIKPSFVIEKIQTGEKRYMSLIFNQSQIEIVGNIFENPDILEAK